MYQQESPYVCIKTYPDLWRKGRYRVDLTAELDLEIDGINAALEQLDYHIIDADQWGQSYVHNRDPRRTAELDEVEDQDSYVKLVLRNGDLDEAEITEAKNYLSRIFDRIYQLSYERYQENNCSYALPFTYTEKY
jgi:hypothetical protein